MSISSVSAFLGAVTAADHSPPARQKTPTGSPMAGELAEIREKGLSVWAHDKKMEALKERLRQQILSEKKLSEDDIAGMGPEEQASVEAEIEKIIAQRLEEAMKTAVEDAVKEGKSQAIVVDIAV